MWFMVRQNVAGELVRPKNMTHGWNSPKGVLNAAFHWSSFLILMLLKPQCMSNLVKMLFPWSELRMTSMRGCGSLSCSVCELRMQ